MLQDALDRRGVHVHCLALINDTVGTLLAHAYHTGDAIIGAIFGTGTNGCYVENVENILRSQEIKISRFPLSARKLIVKTECKGKRE
jgi:hexokinase